MDWFTPEVAQVVAGIVGAIIAAAIGLIKSEAKRKAVEAVVDVGIPIAFNVVQEISKRTENKIDDKAALALQYLAEYTGTKGVKLSEDHKARAALVFKSLHAQSKGLGVK